MNNLYIYSLMAFGNAHLYMIFPISKRLSLVIPQTSVCPYAAILQTFLALGKCS